MRYILSHPLDYYSSIHNDFYFEPAGDFIDAPEIIRRHICDKKRVLTKLAEMNIEKDVIPLIMDQLDENFI